MICADCKRFGMLIRRGDLLLCVDCRSKPKQEAGTIQIHVTRATDRDSLRAQQGRLAAS